ncbi:MAG: TetR/AcrR family transcriptional regulator [Actinomycetota bacterium]
MVESAPESTATPPQKRGRGRPRNEEPSPEYVARHSEILDVAAKVFSDKGYDAGSLDEIADALDLRKATLYYYVRSKAELLYLIFDRAITQGLEQLASLSESDSGYEIVEKLVHHQIRGVAESPELFGVFFDNRPRLDQRYEESIRAKEQQYLQLFADLLSKAASDGAVANVDSRYAAHAIIGMTTWIYKWFDPARDDVDGFAATATALVLKDPPAGLSRKPARQRPPRRK